MNIVFEVKPAVDEPIYRQLAQAIEEAIESGRLQAGDYLPTTREMASALQLARGIVAKAYGELLAKGYLRSRPGVGTTVNLRPSAIAGTNPEPAQEDFGVPAAPILSKLGERLLQMETAPDTAGDLKEFNHGCTAREFLPIARWRELMVRYCRPPESEKLEYITEPFGYAPLRKSITRYLARSKGVLCKPEQVIIFPNSQRVFDSVLTLLVNPGDMIAVEDPGYVGIRENAAAWGIRLHPVPIDGDGLMTTQLPDSSQSCKLLHTTPNCQDPTGATMPMSRKIELARWLHQSGAYIIEDAWDSDYQYATPAARCLQSICPDQVLYLYTPWKVLYPLTSIGFLVVPPALIPAFTRLKRFTECMLPALDTLVLTDFISDGHLDKHIDRVLKIHRQRRQASIFALTTSFRNQITVFPKTAGLHLRFQLAVDTNESIVLALAKQLAIPLLSTRPYYLGQPPPAEFLMQFALESSEVMTAKIEELARLLKAPQSVVK